MCNTGSSHHFKLFCKMTILVHRYCGLNLAAVKHLLKTFLSHCCLFSPITESPSKCCHCSFSAFSVEIVDASPECEELISVNFSASVFSLYELCASLSTVETEVGNVHISIDNLITHVASELKDLHATMETGFVCFHFLVWSIHCLHSLGQCFICIRQFLICCHL